MYIVANYNDMITLDVPKGAVCVILKDGHVEGGPVYKFNGQEWIRVQFGGGEVVEND